MAFYQALKRYDEHCPRRMTQTLKLSQKLNLNEISFLTKQIHGKWKVAKQNDIKRIQKFTQAYYLYLKDDECKIIKSKTLKKCSWPQLFCQRCLYPIPATKMATNNTPVVDWKGTRGKLLYCNSIITLSTAFMTSHILSCVPTSECTLQI